jgi:hypothetical protein
VAEKRAIINALLLGLIPLPWVGLLPDALFPPAADMSATLAKNGVLDNTLKQV